MTGNIQVDDIWITRKIYEDAENDYYEKLAKAALTPLAGEVAKARERLIQSRNTFTTVSKNYPTAVKNLEKPQVPSVDSGAIKFIEKKVLEFEKSIDSILKHLTLLDNKVATLENIYGQAKSVHEINIATAKSAPVNDDDDDDDGVDLFASDSDEEESAAAIKLREERLKAYEAKKSKKPVLIAKSNIILDVKPWDDETDMKEMEEQVRKITMDGLLWGASKLVPLAFGIHKLQIACVVEDEKVSIDALTEQIQEIEEFVQSVDIAAFNKI